MGKQGDNSKAESNQRSTEGNVKKENKIIHYGKSSNKRPGRL